MINFLCEVYNRKNAVKRQFCQFLRDQKKSFLFYSSICNNFQFFRNLLYFSLLCY